MAQDITHKLEQNEKHVTTTILRKRPTRASKATANIILQERDIIILEFVSKFGVVNDSHVIHTINLFGKNTNKITLKNYNRIIRRLTGAGYIKRTKLIASTHSYITLDKNGEIMLGAKRVKQLVIPTLRHDMLVLDLYCDLQRMNPSYTFTSEHELKQKSDIHISDKTKIPDLLINDSITSNIIAIEMELSEKNNAILSNIILNYIYNSQITEAWYFVQSVTLGNKIHTISGSDDNCNKIKVFLLNTQINNSMDARFTYTEIINSRINPQLNQPQLQQIPQHEEYQAAQVIYQEQKERNPDNPHKKNRGHHKNSVENESSPKNDHTNNSTLIGHNQQQQPIFITDHELNQHTLITGTTGSGKTTTILNFVESAARRNLPIIYLDGKGSPDLIDKLALSANKHNRKFKVFTLRPEIKTPYLASYNPFGSGGATEWKNRIMALFSQVTGRGQEHFSLGEQHYINFVANILADFNRTGELVDLRVLLSFLENRDNLTKTAHDLSNSIMAHKLLELHQSKDIKHLLGDVLKLLELFFYSDYGYLFDTKGVLRDNVINLKQSILNNEIVLFLFDASAYAEDTNKVAKMVINDLNSSFADIGNFTKCFCIFDEFASYASSNLAETISLHRSQGMHAIIGTQSIATVKLKSNETRRIAEELIACCNTYITQAINHPADAETLAHIMGTKQGYTINTQISNSNNSSQINTGVPQMFNINNIFGNNINNSSSRVNSIRYVEEFKIPPQQLKDLRQGEAIIYRKAAGFDPIFVRICQSQ
jgi:hypothetical protein